ncbi:sensor histidine kinase [soil metagenome]
MRGPAAFCFVLLFALALSASAGFTRGPGAASPLDQYKHSRWSAEDGAPVNIAAIAQSADGFLWLGTGSGLYRFDGVRFERIAPIPGDRTRSPQVSSLAVTRTGDLWVGYRWGGVAVYRDGRLQPVEMPRSGQPVIAMVEDAAGDIWAINSRYDSPLSRYSHGRWTSVGVAEGVSNQPLGALLAPSDGSIWIAGWDGALVRRPGQTRFQTIEGSDEGTNMTLSIDGQSGVWMLGAAGPRLLWADGAMVPAAEGEVTGLEIRTHRSPRMMLDQQGGMWAADQEKGLIHVQVGGIDHRRITPQSIQQVRRSDGLTSDTVTAIFPGREGEVWVGTTAGLDRFRPANVRFAPGLSPDGYGVLFADRRGTLYLIDSHNVYRIGPGGRRELLTSALSDVGAICDAPDGSLWLDSGVGLVHITGRHVAIEPQPFDPEHTSFACVAEPNGRLWLAAGPDGLFRRDGAQWTAVTLGSGAPNAVGLREDGQGGLLVNVRDKGLYRIEGDQTRFLWDGAAIGRITAIGPYRGAMLAVGPYGVARFDGTAFTVLSSDRYPWLANTMGLTQTATDAWFLTDRGVVRVGLQELERAMRDQGALKHQIFDAQDGLAATVQTGSFRPLTSSGDGRIWISTADGAFWIDPAHMTLNTLPPSVVVTALVSDGRRKALGPRVTLAAGASHIQIDFTALSLPAPERVRFLYRLEGADANWVDPGTRRQAFYTNLRPGVYRFQVIAANNDGIWNPVGATQEFWIPPTFFQSIWFVILCLGAAGFGLWVAYRLRLRYVTDQLRARIEARVGERERIARELHDTLLQGFQGLMLRFQAVAERLPLGQTERTLIDKALDQADAVLIEGRDHLQALRASSEIGDLCQMLAQVAHDLSAEGAPMFHLVVEGEPRDLRGLALEELSRIGQEAIRNAFKHAGAKAVEARVRYSRREFVLTIRDDGVGIAAEIADRARSGGHFGLVGIRERAVRIGGRLTIDSSLNAGTAIVVALSSRSAYEPRNGWRDLLSRWRAVSRGLEA